MRVCVIHDKSKIPCVHRACSSYALIYHYNLAKAMHIPVTARLNYFNSVVQEFSAGFLYCLQLLQNVAAYLITGLSSCDLITLILHSSHWLSI